MNSFPRSLLHKTVIAVLAAGAVAGSASGAPVALQDVPLYLLSRADPNVLLNMSVETPMGGAAYTDNVGVPTGCAGRVDVGGHSVGACYLPAYEYIGYFNPRKCYSYASTQFNPTGSAAGLPNHTCSGAWSGNFLNWMSMTAIDMFIRTMTGGNRIVDSTTETVVRRVERSIRRIVVEGKRGVVCGDFPQPKYQVPGPLHRFVEVRPSNGRHHDIPYQ